MLNAEKINHFHSISLNGLASHLFRDGMVNAENIQTAVHQAREQGLTLTSYLVRFNILSSQTILDYCAKQFGLPIFDLKNDERIWTENLILKPELIYRYRILPLHHDQKYLYLGITDPTDHATITAIEFHAGLFIRPMLIAEDMLDKIIETHFHPTDLNSQLESALSKVTPLEQTASPQESTEENDEPVIKFVDQLLQNAIQHHASDIHIEPNATHCRIRFRQDGLLYEAANIPLYLAIRITTRLKIIANLNIAERRLPQDGRIQLRQSSRIDIRINTCPTIFGEKIVLRILDSNTVNFDINMLGFTDIQKQLFLEKLTQPQGLIIVSGPTGSGKTSTLYSALQHLNQIEKNISTVEDPVEIELKGVNQVYINTKIGLDFACVLRTFLRQDPDIIMVGEIRDAETAMIAVQAAQTGHLVLSTLHTNSAAETIVRLQSMGLLPYHLVSSISLIIAQRLVRKLCDHCKQPEMLPTECHQQFKSTSPFIAYKAHGCKFCHQGFKGRIGIFELIPMTDKIIPVLLTGANMAQIHKEIKTENCMLLWEAGLEKVRLGITSFTEIIRVVGK